MNSPSTAESGVFILILNVVILGVVAPNQLTGVRDVRDVRSNLSKALAVAVAVVRDVRR